MLDPALRRRLSDLARGKTSPLPVAPIERVELTPLLPAKLCEFRPCVVCNEHGDIVANQVAVCDLHPNPAELLSRFNSVAVTMGIDPCRTLFLDLETTGFSQVPVFLAGLLSCGENGLRIRQLFARTYAEEKSLLCEIGHALEECECVITFNGNTFDLPYIRNRAIAHLLPLSVPGRRLDVFPHARRKWKGKFPNCRLQTLETFVCQRCRSGDIPGHLIPETYRDYVRSGDITPLLPVFHHNALDLLTTLELMVEVFS